MPCRESQAKLHKNTAVGQQRISENWLLKISSYPIQFSLANLAWMSPIQAQRLKERYLSSLYSPGSQLLPRKELQNMTLLCKRFMWIHMTIETLLSRSGRRMQLLHQQHNIEFSYTEFRLFHYFLAQSRHTVLSSLGACMQSAGGHRCTMAGNEYAEGSKITVQLIILKDRNYMYCE